MRFVGDTFSHGHTWVVNPSDYILLVNQLINVVARIQLLAIASNMVSKASRRDHEHGVANGEYKQSLKHYEANGIVGDTPTIW